MTEKEVQEKFGQGIQHLKNLEVLIKSQESNFDTHIERINMLKFLADRLTELRDHEMSSLEQPLEVLESESN